MTRTSSTSPSARSASVISTVRLIGRSGCGGDRRNGSDGGDWRNRSNRVARSCWAYGPIWVDGPIRADWHGTRFCPNLGYFLHPEQNEEFQRFPNPLAPVGRGQNLITMAMDSKGNFWTSERAGAYRLNPQTGEYTEYKTATKEGQPYGLTIDSEDNTWFAQWQGDTVSVVNARTGQVTDINMAVTGVEFDPRDREIGERSGWPFKVPPIWKKGPRRIGEGHVDMEAGRRGRTVRQGSRNLDERSSA